jgi:hypothetical protein
VNLSGPNGQQRSAATLDVAEVHHGAAYSASDVDEHVKVIAVVTLQMGSGHPSSQVRHRKDLEIQRYRWVSFAAASIHCPIFTIWKPTLIVSKRLAT